MAVWAGLGQAATVAQLLGGVDAGGLISLILQAAATARRNRRDCDQLARRVLIIADLLPHLHGPEVVMRRPLEGLEDALREAHQLVLSCQGRSAAYRFLMAASQAERFRDVHARIDLCIGVFPLVTHITITRRLDRIIYDDVQLSNHTIVTTVRVEDEAADEVRGVHGGAEELTFAAAAAATNSDSAASGATSTAIVVRRLFTSWCAEMEKRLLSFRQRKEEADRDR